MALVREMQKHATHDAGVWRLPDGAAYYKASLKSWATTDKSPEEIHKLGLEVVADSTAKIDALMKAQGMTKGSVGDRLRAMFKDPKFLFPNTDAAKDKVIADLNAKVHEVRAKLPAWFATLPKADVTIKRVPKTIEAAQPLGYYNQPSLDGKRPGIYWINLRDPREVPSWTLPSVTFHESIPGHHLQLSLQQEAGLPLIRKTAFFSAYIEGWALYAEQLAVEMGLYDHDPLGHIGQLHDAMWRGIRLVVDSGMHAMKWSREKAVSYFAENAGDPESAVATEVERYCVWPGQACSYMLGKLEFLEQRERAEAALGAKFDIRKFHDAHASGGRGAAVADAGSGRHVYRVGPRRLSMKVAVLGSGVIGVTTAYYLALSGHEVVVVDRQSGPALETSFANAGEISPGYASPWAAPDIPMKALKWLFMRYSPLILRPKPDPRMIAWMFSILRNCTSARYARNKARMMRLAGHSREMLIKLRDDTGIQYDQRMQGTLQLFRAPHQLDGMAKDIAVLRAGGVPFEILDRQGSIAAEPGLAFAHEPFVGGSASARRRDRGLFQVHQRAGGHGRSKGRAIAVRRASPGHRDGRARCHGYSHQPERDKG